MLGPYKEPMELINLGTEENKTEVRIGELLDSNAKHSLKSPLREYVDVFSWSYQDMPELDTDIVEHKLHSGPNAQLGSKSKKNSSRYVRQNQTRGAKID